MKKPLLDLIFASDKRKSALLLLQNGPLMMETLLNSLNTTRQSLLPQMRILEEHHLITKSDDSFGLTTIGELIVDEMVSLVDTVDVLDTDVGYWGTHDLDFIPEYLFKRINELAEIQIINPPVVNIHDLMQELYNASKDSRSLNLATVFYHPQFPELFADLVKLNIHVYLIISRDLLDKFTIKVGEDLDELLKSQYFHLSVYSKEMNFMSFAYSDTFFRISPLKNTGEYDYTYLISFNEQAIEWGKDLFAYYFNDSKSVYEL
ncbi:helix-turn-helix transcriptional regulator [Methanolobus halotolerans]|uniref:Transcriptional regulator n=1 Tax=Methanolobus halotolerans TaxID=2052935 RepID=A0A4E0PYK0_9EURY|nr:winged helix-turn-helix domain-containing protein [Methanolobus halotolerans]TGC08755.1 transcriptional regulator [Methanolobus halotolerans]